MRSVDLDPHSADGRYENSVVAGFAQGDAGLRRDHAGHVRVVALRGSNHFIGFCVIDNDDAGK